MQRCTRFLVAAVALFALAAPSHAADLEPLQTLRQATQGIDGLSGAEEVVVTSDGAFIYVAAEDQDAIGIFSLNETTGAIAFVSTLSDPGLTPKSLALSPEPMNPHLYVTSPTRNQIIWYDRNPTTGALSNAMSITGDATVGLMQAWSVAVSDDGLHVYVTGLADESVAAFDRNTTTGVLTHAETFFDTLDEGMENPFEVRVSPDDTQVLVASQGDDTVVGLAFDRLPADPLVTPFVPIPVLVAGRGSSKSVAFSQDGTSAYFGVQTATSTNPGIAVYSRNPATNVLTPFDLVDEPELLTVVSLAVSPDHRSLVAVLDTPGSLRTYQRSTATGGLTFFEEIQNLDQIPGTGMFVGLNGATSVVITESGDHTLAVAKGSTDDALNLFAPEPGGALLAVAALGTLGALTRRRARGETRI